MSYQVKLEIFEGPLDLLLFFIKRDEINIYDIPISDITNEYLQYLDMMQQKNLHLAGEFIHMAALLMQIKVRMLLPKGETEPEENAEDPRTELVQMLVEYRKYKEVCTFLREIEEKQTRFHTVSAVADVDQVDADIFLGEVELIDLGIAFKELLDKMPKPKYYEVKQMKINISRQSELIRSMLDQKPKFKFSDLAAAITNRIELVVTFLAVLELIKTETIDVIQRSVFGDFIIRRRKEEGANAVTNA